MIDVYANPDLYEAIHKNYSWDKQLITSAATEAGGPVLELASGTGRLAQLILDLGLNYTGIDLSAEFVKVAREKFGNLATFHLGNMQRFNLDQTFNFIFIGFNSFLHNLTDESALDSLTCVNNHLSDSGTFLVSIFIPDPSFLYRDKNRLYPAMSMFDFNGAKCRIMESNVFDDDTQINQITWRLERDEELLPDTYHYSMRMFYPHTMDILLNKTGLKIIKKLGDYDGTPMDEESGMQIYVCKKA